MIDLFNRVCMRYW